MDSPKSPTSVESTAATERARWDIVLCGPVTLYGRPTKINDSFQFGRFGLKAEYGQQPAAIPANMLSDLTKLDDDTYTFKCYRWLAEKKVLPYTEIILPPKA